MAEKLSGSEARQGSRGKPAFYVLLASMVMLFFATIGLMLWNGAEAPKTYNEKSQASVPKTATGGQSNSASSANTSGVPATNPAYPAPVTSKANT